MSTATIDASGLSALLETDPEVRILDVRTGGEFETAHIPGSTNVPLDTLREHARELADVDRPVVLVCQSGARASQAGDELARAGKGHLQVLDGGMNAWASAGGAVARGEHQRWAMERQVRLVAGSIVLGSVVASAFVPRLKWLAAGIGTGLVYSAVSDTCTMARGLERLPYNRTGDCDIAGALAELEGASDGEA